MNHAPVHTRFATPRVLQARDELLRAVQESVRLSDLTFDQAQGKLSALVSEFWNEADRALKTFFRPSSGSVRQRLDSPKRLEST